MVKQPDSNPQNQREFIDYRFNDVFKRLDKQDGKLDGLRSTMENFAFVKQSDFEEFKKEIKETYATKEEISPLKKVFYGILAAAIAGFVGLFFWLIQFLITKAAS